MILADLKLLCTHINISTIYQVMTLLSKHQYVRPAISTTRRRQCCENAILEFFARWEERDLILMKKRMLDCHRARRKKVHFEDENHLMPIAGEY